MSRFFQQSSSEESSSEEDELYQSSSSEEEEEEQSSEEESSDESDSDSDSDSDSGKGGKNKFLKNKFLKGAASDSESDSDDEDKRVVKSAKDKMIDEIDAISKSIDNGKKINDWVLISAEFDKLNKLADKIIKQYSITPKKYIKAIADLETFAADTVKDQKTAKKKMSNINARTLTATTQRVKKNNRVYATLISEYHADPEAFLVETPTASEPKKASQSTFASISKPAPISDEGFTTVGRPVGNAFATLETIMEARGKKGINKEKQVQDLEELFESATQPYIQIIVLLRLIPLKFDLAPANSSLPVEQWNNTKDFIVKLFDILEANISKYQLSDSASEPEDIEKGLAPREDGVQEIPGSLAAFVERLDDEFTKSLLDIDPHTTEYVERLYDENSLYTLILRTQIYFEQTVKTPLNQCESLSRIVSRRVDRIYFKPSVVVIAAETAAWKSLNKKADSKITPRIQSEVPETYVIDLVSKLCSVLYKQSNTIYRTRAMLCQIYNFAINDMYYKARDLMLMCHLQTNIHGNEIPLLILFNRTLIQIGLCAFRKGLISECQQTLSDVSLSPRLKELLGQGIAKTSAATSTENKQRMLPFHMHINLELLECVNLTASLLLEIPAMAASERQVDGKKKVVSRTFRRMLDNSVRQVFTGPPENTRDHIMHAARALLDCEWAKARDLLNSIKIWSLLSNPAEIKVMLAEKLQIEGLRTYLFRYGSTYQSLNFKTLSTLFDLPERRVYAVISKMIANEEIDAALDQKTDSVIFRQGVELSKLQHYAVSLSEKAVQLVERNERLAAGGFTLETTTNNSNNNNNNSGNNNSNNNNNNNNNSNSKGNASGSANNNQSSSNAQKGDRRGQQSQKRQ